MIREAAETYAAAIAELLGEVVPVLDHPPDTIAPPAVWVELVGVDFDTGSWQVRHQAVVVVDVALTPLDAATLRDTLTDRVILAASRVGTPAAVVAGPLFRSIGGVQYPAATVLVVQPVAMCDLNTTGR